jgi:hypothetical protein
MSSAAACQDSSSHSIRRPQCRSGCVWVGCARTKAYGSTLWASARMCGGRWPESRTACTSTTPPSSKVKRYGAVASNTASTSATAHPAGGVAHRGGSYSGFDGFGQRALAAFPDPLPASRRGAVDRARCGGIGDGGPTSGSCAREGVVDGRGCLRGDQRRCAGQPTFRGIPHLEECTGAEAGVTSRLLPSIRAHFGTDRRATGTAVEPELVAATDYAEHGNRLDRDHSGVGVGLRGAGGVDLPTAGVSECFARAASGVGSGPRATGDTPRLV